MISGIGTSSTSFNYKTPNQVRNKNADDNKFSMSDLIKSLEESHKQTVQDLKEEKDWRDMSDDEWDKMLEGVDEDIEAFKEYLEHVEEMQDEAAKKAALEADSDMRATAASSAALSVAANGLGGTTEADSKEIEDEETPAIEGEERKKNWTKLIDTDDQTVLRTAKKAQEMEKMAQRRLEKIVNDSEYASHEYISVGENDLRKWKVSE